MNLLTETNSKLQIAKRLGVIAMGLILSACMAGKPKITSKDSQGGNNNTSKNKTSTKVAMPLGTGWVKTEPGATACAAGTSICKIKVNISSNENGKNTPNIGGGLKIRPILAGVANEAF